MDFPRTCGPSLLCSLSALHVFGFGHITDISELRSNLARRLFNPNLCLIVVVVVKCQSTLRKRGRKRKSFGVKRASFASQSYAKKQRKHVCNLTTPSPGVIAVSSRASEQDVRRLRVEQKAQARIFLKHYPRCQSEQHKDEYLKTNPPTGDDSWWLALCRDRCFRHDQTHCNYPPCRRHDPGEIVRQHVLNRRFISARKANLDTEHVNFVNDFDEILGEHALPRNACTNV